MDTSDRGNFTDVLTATIKRLIESSKTYMNENVLPQARSILLKCGELIEFYGRKKFNLLQVRIEFGNIYSTLECKLGNHKHVLLMVIISSHRPYNWLMTTSNCRSNPTALLVWAYPWSTSARCCPLWHVTMKPYKYWMLPSRWHSTTWTTTKSQSHKKWNYWGFT